MATAVDSTLTYRGWTIHNFGKKGFYTQYGVSAYNGKPLMMWAKTLEKMHKLIDERITV